jgi:hypothetical protein
VGSIPTILDILVYTMYLINYKKRAI